MSGPFVYIGTYTVKDGKLQECKDRLEELVDLVETNEPRLIGFNVYLDEQGRKVSIVQVHPDPASMEHHMKVVSHHLSGAFDYLESTVSSQIYGSPSDSLSETLRAYTPPEVPVTSMPIHGGGFVRAAVR